MINNLLVNDMNYIISGPGRVGGHLLEGIIRSTGQQNVHRTHDPTLDLGNDQRTVLIVVDRRDRFAAIMSNAIARHTGQTTDYPNKTPQPFELNPGMFRWEYVQHIDYYKKFDLARPYAAVFKIYFEDFVNKPEYVKRILDLPTVPVDKKSKAWELMNSPAPYNYKNIISNWEKLQRLYHLMSNNND